MKYKTLFFIVFMVITVSSQSITYKMNEIERIYNGKNGNKDSTLILTFSYPIFDSPKSNDTIPLNMNSIINSEVFGDDMGGAKGIYDYLVDMVQEDEDSSYFSGQWTYTTEVSNIYYKDNLFSLYLFHDDYLGGAHPSSYGTGLNFDCRTGQLITEDDIYKAGYKPELNKLAEEMLRKEREIPATQTLTDYGYWFENDKFDLNFNIVISAEGITYTFNPYEVAPYAVGYSVIFIPYSAIKHLINPNGIIGWAAK